jgi:hypothetical protein
MAQHWGSARQSGSGERRLAEEFDLALSGARSGGSRGTATRRTHPNAAASAYEPASDGSGAAPATQVATLVAVAHRVERTGAALPGMDEAFRAQLRERLVRLTPELAAASAKAQVPAQRGGRHAGLRRPVSARSPHTGISAAWRRRLLAAGVGVAVATGSVGGIAIASAGAVPGDPLYSAKKMFENIQLSLSGSPTDRGGQYLHLADIRLSEIDALLSRRDADVPGSPTAAYLDQALTDLQSMIGDGGDLLLDQVRQHADEQALHALSDFLLTERQRVVDLTWQLPLTLQRRPAQIVALMDDLYRQLQQAAAAMPHAGAAPTPSSGIQPGGGTGTGPGAGAHGSPSHAGQSSAAHNGSPSAVPSGQASNGPGASPSAQPSATATPTIGVQLPLPILPSTGINLPPLLPGLPGIDLGLGGSESSPSPTE